MQRIIEGTWEEIKQREAELVGHWLRVSVRPAKLPPSALESAGIVSVVHRNVAKVNSNRSALGKYAFVWGGSEAFAARKQEEIDSEDNVAP